MSHEQGENRINAIMEFDEMLLISQCHSKGRRYPVIKNWFLENYPEIRAFGMVEIPGFKIVPRENASSPASSTEEKLTA